MVFIGLVFCWWFYCFFWDDVVFMEVFLWVFCCFPRGFVGFVLFFLLDGPKFLRTRLKAYLKRAEMVLTIGFKWVVSLVSIFLG